jgi:Glu-tRNA(Gln) amidotransferase subunit E-like FAD-binding protein
MREVIIDLSVTGAQRTIMLGIHGNVTVKDINLRSRKDEAGHN